MDKNQIKDYGRTVIMKDPGMTASQLMAHIKRQFPNTPILNRSL